MVQKLPLTDFRAIRAVLDPEDFALHDGSDEPFPTDLIPEDAWKGIMTLPDDVAIQTTSHQGDRVALLYELWSVWIGMLPCGSIVGEGMLAVSDDFAAALFNLLHGFYKQAIASLRNALELMVFACDCHLTRNQRKWAKWQSGGEELRFNNISKSLAERPEVRAPEDTAVTATGKRLLPSRESNEESWSQDLYRRLCHFSHPRGRTTNSYLWQSNGPIYSAEGMRSSYHAFLETFALLTLLIKISEPTVALPHTARLLFKAGSIQQYLPEPFHGLANYHVEFALRR